MRKVSGSSCVMTQHCERGSNNKSCIPELSHQPPTPMTGPHWTSTSGGGHCRTSSECNSNNGNSCINNQCQCINDGITGGLHCNETLIQCPAFKNASCCSYQQNTALASNFKLIANLFGGNTRGGCDACAANIMNLWCNLVCSPSQSSFMTPASAINNSQKLLPDPLNNNQLTKVLAVNATISSDTACSVFDSCSSLGVVKQAMPTALRFLSYQGQTGAIAHGEFFNFAYKSNTAAALSLDVLHCSQYFTSSLSLLPTQATLLPTIQSRNKSDAMCPCVACRATCSASSSDHGFHPIKLVSNPISPTTGINTLNLGITLLIIFMSTTTILVIINLKNRRRLH